MELYINNFKILLKKGIGLMIIIPNDVYRLKS